jgi:hypothetical protein
MIAKVKAIKFIIQGNDYNYIIVYLQELVYNTKLDIKNITYSKAL